MAKVYVINNVAKNGTIVTVNIEGKEKPVTFDMTTKTLRSYTGREIQRFPVGEYHTNTINDNIITKLLFKSMLSGSVFSILDNLERLELFINNPELLNGIEYPSYIPCECPKGYINWLKENNYPLDKNTLMEYKIYKKVENLDKESKEIYELLVTAPNAPFHDSTDIWKTFYLNMENSLRKKFNQILKMSLKELSWHLQADIETFVNRLLFNKGWNLWRNEHRPNNWENLLNVERTFAWNMTNIIALSKSSWEEDIIHNENKIRKIEELSNEKFKVIVPKTLEDLTKEGNMQKNCVGHFYHNSIANGQNLIYFIRYTETPEKSYLTNRYNVDRHKTTESRLKCNDWNTDDAAWELIKEIDKVIADVLSE